MEEKETNIYDPFDVLTENFTEDYDWQEFTSKLNSLPQTLRDLLFDPGLIEFIMDISTDSALSEAQTKKLSEVIGEFIMGSLSANDMPNILTQSGMAPDIAQKISNKISGGGGETSEVPQQYSPPVKPAQPQYIPPPPPRSQNPPTNPGNVVDLRNGNNNQ